ncbi:related to DNA-directed RNA polymerase III chain RPC82 [Cephalotrichum gorgonifer]|uniref:DNA-directed RNA polymerase III subunit RPC3 n=1 Tax=Cephalotrichum gorgonifer TaxID=2041049 RepID=A0AAE8N6E0_9PEZI|nr:related to DNA-directed RNA polymerase III chain RPC82 [Cephalotrichum gorgonifer]
MIVTKHAAELCTLLVNDVFGELPSRIFETLCQRGPCRLPQLFERTGLNPHQVRHGLAVLIQHDLLYYTVNEETNTTTYEANTTSCYNILRVGRIVDLVGTVYGRAEQEVVRHLLSLGHVQIADLAQAFGAQGASTVESTLDAEDTESALKTNGDSGDHTETAPFIKSVFHLHEVIARLIQWEILEVVDAGSFTNPEAIYNEIEQAYAKKAASVKSSKGKDDLAREKACELRAARDRGKELKRQLDSEAPVPDTKRRKLTNGQANGTSSPQTRRVLDSSTVVRINYEKCLVDLRNDRLTRFADDVIGRTTSRVYNTLLRLVSRKISRCVEDVRIDGAFSEMFDDGSSHDLTVTTLDILDALDPSVNLASDIGRVSKKSVDPNISERLLQIASLLDVDQEAEAGGENGLTGERHFMDDDDSDLEDVVPNTNGTEGGQNDTRNGQVKSENGPAEQRVELLRRHMFLLCESKHRFVRHCGTQGDGQWTVDFDIVMQSLRQVEMDAIIEQVTGRRGLRLTRILRDFGKLDEKALANKALMKKPTLQGKMVELQRASFVDVQEVPRDNNRIANRTMFFWHCDTDRLRRELPDRIFKSMLRCLQVLEVERYKVRDILEFVHRTDVKGKEEEVMTPEYYNKYSQHLELEAKLLGHAMRLDEIVAVLRDY